MKTVEMQIPKKASAMQSICEWMEVWNTNFHYCSYAPDVWFWINMSLRAITRTHFERRHGKQSFMYLWLGYLKKLFVDAILDSYKYVCLRQKFVLFCLFLQPNCFCHWLAAKQDLILLVLLGRNTCLPPRSFIFWTSRAPSSGRLPIACELHWRRRDQPANGSRLARLPRPSTSEVVPGRLSLTTKLLCKKTSNLEKTARCWCIKGLIRTLGEPTPTSKLIVLIFTRLLVPNTPTSWQIFTKFLADPSCLSSRFNT